MPQSFKTVLITGCSSGFGLLTAARLAARGYLIFATMRDVSRSDELLAEVKKRGGRVTILPLDVTSPKTIQSAITQMIKTAGRVDVVINNAGYGIGGFFEDLSSDEIRAQMEVNFFGVQNVCRVVLPHMRNQGSGKIINISSVAGINASPCFSAYNASKWALEAFSESLMHELKFFGIDVLLIEPGSYPTKIFYENARYAQAFSNPQSPYREVSRFLKKKVMNFVNQCKKDPEDVAALIERLIERPSPSFRNFPDIESRIIYLLRRILPFKIYTAIYRKLLFSGFDPRPTSGVGQG